MTMHEKAITQLINCMTTTRSARCSSEDAYQYCCKLLDVLHEHEINDETLQDLTNSTIARKQITAEDVLRGARRI